MADAADNHGDKDQKPADASADKASETGTSLIVATSDTASAGPTADAPSWFARMQASAATMIPSRRAAFAAGIGLIASAGLLAGTVGLMGIEHLTAAPTTKTPAAPMMSEETRALKQTIARLETQITALKTSVDASTRRANAQRNQINERHEHTTRSQTEMQARLTKMGETVDRLEKRVSAVAASETTGSVAPRYAAAAAAIQPPPAEAKPVAQRPIIRGWVIRSVFGGRAIVASRRGNFEAAPGLFVPGLGQVEAVTRQGDRWVVIAEKGIIRSMLRPPRPRAAYGYELN